MGKKKEYEAINPQLCWPFLRYRHEKHGCQSRKICGRLHPQICQASWETGECDKKDTFGDGYHIGEKPGQPKTKNRRKLLQKASRRLTENSTKINEVTRKEQRPVKERTIQRTDASTAMPRSEAQGRQGDVARKEQESMKEFTIKINDANTVMT